MSHFQSLQERLRDFFKITFVFMNEVDCRKMRNNSSLSFELDVQRSHQNKNGKTVFLSAYFHTCSHMLQNLCKTQFYCFRVKLESSAQGKSCSNFKAWMLMTMKNSGDSTKFYIIFQLGNFVSVIYDISTKKTPSSCFISYQLINQVRSSAI